jgi:hypothetical protein
VQRLADLPDGTVVDGELVAIDDTGRPDFHLLQNSRAEPSRIHYYIFDLLCCKDQCQSLRCRFFRECSRGFLQFMRVCDSSLTLSEGARCGAPGRRNAGQFAAGPRVVPL